MPIASRCRAQVDVFLLMGDTGSEFFSVPLSIYPLLRQALGFRPLLRFGFIVQFEQTGGRSRGRRTRVVGGVGEKGQQSDARDRASLRKRRRHETRRMEREETQDKFAPRVTVWPRAAGQTSACSVQCHAGRPGAQIIHNCIANAADVDVVSTSRGRVSSEARKTIARARVI